MASQIEALKSHAYPQSLSALSLTGYASTSFRWTPTSFAGNDLYDLSGGTDRRDRFALDVVSIKLASQNVQDDWAARLVAQGWFGPDADLLNTSDSSDTEVAIKEAYIQIHIPVGSGIGLKAGVFDTVIGYEATDRADNPFYSHSWGYTVEPTQHTGFMFDYTFSNDLTTYFGIANTTSPKINGLADNDNNFTLIGALEYQVPENIFLLGNSTITTGVVEGRPWDAGLNDQPIVREEYYYLGIKGIKTPIEDLTLGTAWDIRVNRGAGKNDDQVLGAYLQYDATNLLEFNLRAERFEAGSGLGSSMSDGWGTTVGGTYKLWHNTQARFEYRYDKTDLPVSGKRGNKALIWNLIYAF